VELKLALDPEKAAKPGSADVPGGIQRGADRKVSMTWGRRGVAINILRWGSDR